MSASQKFIRRVLRHLAKPTSNRNGVSVRTGPRRGVWRHVSEGYVRVCEPCVWLAINVNELYPELWLHNGADSESTYCDLAKIYSYSPGRFRETEFENEYCSKSTISQHRFDFMNTAT